jgi:2-amino-4-hydroxy-6-hydroxymethyldihydropteridine diphosphokinase
MATVYVGLGSNIAPETHLPAAAARLGELVRVTAVSRVYRTPPWGEPDQPDFLNAVAAGETALPPLALLDGLLAIETALRRTRARRWGPRTADLDLLMYDDLVLESDRLVLPHARLHERAFVLVPICELAPGLAHPRLGKTMAELLGALDATGIEPVELDLGVRAPAADPAT